MTKELAKELLPIITAFAEGKKIQQYMYNHEAVRSYENMNRSNNLWVDIDEIDFKYPISSRYYRIKPEEEIHDGTGAGDLDDIRVHVRLKNEPCNHEYGFDLKSKEYFCKHCGEILPMKKEEEICIGCGKPLSEHTDKDDVKFTDELSHENIMKMWWKLKTYAGWCKVTGYDSNGNKKYILVHPTFTGVYSHTAEELMKDWEYAEYPPEGE